MAESLRYLKTYYGVGNKDASFGTIQVNIRMPRALINDIDFICDMLRIERSDWLRIKIAEMVATEILTKKTEVTRTVSKRFLTGAITEETFEEIVGFKPPKELLEKKRKYEELTKQSTEQTKKYLRELVHKKS